MTQEEKDLLVKDLCPRLPYGVVCQVDDGAAGLNDGKLVEIDISKELVRFDADYYWDAYIDDIKPYLFPMSSMTEEQTKEYEGIIYKNIELHCERYYDVIDIDDFDCLIDFYHKYHLDYRGLIPMGLAIDATDKNIY